MTKDRPLKVSETPALLKYLNESLASSINPLKERITELEKEIAELKTGR